MAFSFAKFSTCNVYNEFLSDIKDLTLVRKPLRLTQ